MANILVTGGAGFIGSNLTKRLLEQGHHVHVLDNLSTGLLENLPCKDVFHKGDARNLSSYPTDRTYDVIYHLAALARIQPSFREPYDTYLVNSFGTVTALEFARKTGARFVYAGSSSFYHDIYANPYTYSKWLGEEHCKLYHKIYDVSTGIARFFNVYGPNQITEGAYATVIGIFEKQKKEDKPLTVTGNGQQRRDFTHVDDIIEGLIALGSKPRKAEIYNLGTGTNYSINEVAHMFHPKEIEYLPERPGEAWITKADIEETTEKLGWKPKISLPEYIAKFLDCL